MYALLICTVLYILIALVLTGMVNYSELKVDDPLAYVFDKLGLKWIGYVISISAVVATTSVLLVFQMGQPRIWMSMSRDGLLPKAFSRIHPKYRTPSFSTIMTGVLVGVPALFANLEEVINLSSIGTLFAFVLVCGGVLVLDLDPENQKKSKFKIPYINSSYYVGLSLILALGLISYSGVNLGEWLEGLYSGETKADHFIMFGFFIIWSVMAFFSVTKIEALPSPIRS